MKVQLQKQVPKVGRAGEIVVVADAYARNYLLPKKLARVATPALLKAVDHQQAKRQRQAEREQAQWKQARKQLTSLTIAVPAKAHENGRLFAAVKAEQLEAHLRQHHHLELPALGWQPKHWKHIGTQTAELTWPDSQRTTITFAITNG